MFINIISMFQLWLCFLISDTNKTVNTGLYSYPRLSKNSGPLTFLNSRHLSFSLMHIWLLRSTFSWYLNT